MAEHIVPKKTYYLVFAALIAGTLLTTGIAFVDLGPFNTVVAITIAICKAILVILFFMHVKYSGRLTWIFVLAGFFWLAILLCLGMADYLTRTWIRT
jgi:cytochrome c oxidase subunit IV